MLQKTAYQNICGLNEFACYGDDKRDDFASDLMLTCHKAMTRFC